MEDYCLDIVVGKDSATVHNIRINLPPFTLVGATTRAGDLSAPLRDRFGIISQLEYYNLSDLEKIVYRTSCVMNTEIDKNAVTEIALRSRGTPRIVCLDVCVILHKSIMRVWFQVKLPKQL